MFFDSNRKPVKPTLQTGYAMNSEARYTIFTSYDAEWHDDLALSVQVFIGGIYAGCIMNITLLDSLPTEVITRLEKQAQFMGIDLLWADLGTSDIVGGIHDAIAEAENLTDTDGDFIQMPKMKEELIYYSPKDIWLGHGWENVKPFFLDGTISKKRNLYGTYKLDKHKYRINDLSGWTNDGLAALAKSVNANSVDKGKMDKYKGNMLPGLMEEPELYLEYSMGDARILPEIYFKFLENTVAIQHETLGVPMKYCFKPLDIPLTIGSVVARIQQSYIKWVVYQDDPELFQFVLVKMGILDSSAASYENSRAAYAWAVNNIKNRDDFNTHRNSRQVKHLLSKAKFDFEAYSYCHVRWFGSDNRTSAAFNALVHGGRAQNERPNTLIHAHTFDADLNSAYGRQLCSNHLPIGIPHVISYTPNTDKRMTLGYFIDRIYPKVRKYSWQLVVSGFMTGSNCQDLVTSKVVDQKTINKAIISGINDEDEEMNDGQSSVLRKIPGIFGIFSKEIRNGIINERTWEVISKAASNSELKDFRAMEIQAGVYYLADDEVSIDVWIDEVLADKGIRHTDKRGNVVDKRTSKYFAFPIGDIFGKTLAARDYWKPRSKDKSLSKEERDLAAGKQNALKLFNNTGYGDFASPYFSIGNVIVANNITAAIRTDAWMMVKALGGNITVTDGCPYNPYEVLKLVLGKDDRKPSFTTFASYDKLVAHKNIKKVALGSKEWLDWVFEVCQVIKSANPMRVKAQSPEFKAAELKLPDEVAYAHIQDFWKPYGLSLLSLVEHKPENTSIASATWSKADYGFKLVEPMLNPKTGVKSEYLYKIRGTKQYKDGQNQSPKYQLFFNMMNGSDEFPEKMEYIHTSLMSPTRYCQVENSNGYLDLKGIRPGDELRMKRVAKFNNDWMMVETFKEYQSRDDRTKKRDFVGFERYQKLGIRAIISRMLANKLK